jgi:hypothetical protein
VHAGIYADVIGSRQLDDPETLLPALGEAVRQLNKLFLPSIAAPFEVAYDDALHGALTDPVQAPLCVNVMRELLAPLQVRVGVAVEGSAEDAFVAAWHEDRLVYYSGSGAAGDLLLNAYSGLVDPLVRGRSDAEWQAVCAVRSHETRAAAASELGIDARRLSDLLSAAHWQEVEDADATIAAYFALSLADPD